MSDGSGDGPFSSHLVRTQDPEQPPTQKHADRFTPYWRGSEGVVNKQVLSPTIF